MNAADIIKLVLPAGAALVAVVLWLARLEGGVKRAQEKAEGACAAVKEIESDVEALRPIAISLEVLAARMAALVEKVADGNVATRERFNALDTKIDHALANARDARNAAAELARRPRPSTRSRAET